MSHRRRSFRRPLAVEQLEGRTLPSGIPFNFTFNDPSGQFAPFPLLLNNLQAAGQILSGVLGGRGSLEVEVVPDNSIPRAAGGTVSVSVVGSEPGYTIVENSTITEARTGIDPNGSLPDIRIQLNTSTYLPSLWFDPSGAARTAPIPPGQTDFISVALHEITHALGFQGYRMISGPGYGTTFFFNTKSTYDTRTDFGTGGDPSILYFNGPHAVSQYGRPVPLTSVGPSHPLTSQNFYHLGNPAGMPGSDLIPDLMNGVVFSFGTRYAPGPLDLAILADLSWTSPSRLQFSSATYTVNENAGVATFTVTRTDGGFGAVSVTYATVPGGTATPGVDYMPVTGTLSWADGDTANKTFTVPIFDDGQAGPDKTVQLALSDPTGTAMLGTPSTAVLTIHDSVPASFRVTGFTATNSGFRVQFNRAFLPDVLNLYDTQAGGLGPADVTLVGSTTGPVRGSLVLDATATGLTFLQTGGVLAADTYTVTLRSAANGFRDPAGALLDGNGDGTPGDDYTTIFTVAPSSAVVVGVRDFMRGPGQFVNVPAGATGLPLHLSDGSGVTSVSLTLAYNPQYLTISAAAVGPNVPAGATATLDTSTPGQALISFTSPTPLPAGAIDFVTLTAQVPNAAGTAYTAKHLLDIGNVLVNNGSLAARDDDGLHLLGYLGDTSGNGSYSSLDAQRALRVAVGLDGGFSAFQLADPLLIADVTDNGVINAADATRILQAALGISQPFIPSLPGDIQITPSGPDPLLHFPRHLRGRPGRTLVVPLLLNPAGGLEAADLAVSYEARQLELLQVRRGSLAQDFDLFAVSPDPQEGTIRVGMARSAGPIPGPQRGSVIDLIFRVRPDAPAGRTVVNLRHDLTGMITQLNEGGLDLNPDPSNEAGDRLDGSIRIGAGRPVRAVDAVFSELGRLLNNSRRQMRR
jgi:hypothetical protein